MTDPTITYVTFGQSHTHTVNGKYFDKDCVAVIRAPTAAEGRERAFELFGNQFCTTYNAMESDTMRFFPRGFIEVEDDEESKNENS